MTSAIDNLKEIVQESQTISDTMRKLAGTPQWRIKSQRAKELLIMKPYLALHYNLFECFPLRNIAMNQSLLYQMESLSGYSPDTNVIFDMIHREKFTEALKLLILTSQVSRGVSASLLEKVGIRLINTLGFDFLKEWNKLLASGLITQEASFFTPSLSDLKNQLLSQRPPKFQTVADHLHLILPGDTPDSPPSKCSGFYQGYIPLSVKLVEEGIRTPD